MDLQQLQKIYPAACLHSYPAEDPAYLSLATKEGFLWLLQADLSVTEKKLLRALQSAPTPAAAVQNRPWYEALFHHQGVPKKGAFRLIQLKCPTLDKISAETLKMILPQMADFIFLSDSYGVLVETFRPDALTTEELEGVFLALDSDLNSYSRLFKGSFYADAMDFTRIFQEEEQLFLHLLTAQPQKKIFDTAAATLSFFAQANVKDSYLMQSLFAQWQDPESEKIIAALWQTQGNVSLAAKELFMHRNTLQYKVDKFQQASNLNLKNMNDLFLCYLLQSTFD